MANSCLLRPEFEGTIQEIYNCLLQMISIVNICSDFPEESLDDAYHDFLVQMRSILNVLQQKNDELFDFI